MALQTTTASLIRQYNAFTGLSALERTQSGIARAEVVYYNVNDTWAAPGVGNDRLYQSGQISLPKDFCYVLTDIFVKVTRASGEHVIAEMVGDVRIFPGGILGPQINTTIVADPSMAGETSTTPHGDLPTREFNTNVPSISGDNGSITYSLRNKPTAIIYPFGSNSYTSSPNPASIFEFSIGENATNGSEYDVSCYVRFLQYDIDQSYNYVVQSPQLTR